MAITGAQPVLQHKGRDAERIEPERDLLALFFHREGAVTAAGAHDYGSAGGARGRREIKAQRGLVGIFGARGAGRALRPKQFDPGFGRLRPQRAESQRRYDPFHRNYCKRQGRPRLFQRFERRPHP